MSNLRPFDQTYTVDREITGQWNGATITEGNEELTQMLQFSVYHSRDHKTFYANLSPFKVGNGFKRWSTDDPGVRILSKPVARYSPKALEEFYAEAFATLKVLSEQPTVAALLSRVNAESQVAA